MLFATMPIVILLSADMLSVIMLNVVAPDLSMSLKNETIRILTLRMVPA
jgi:hypothetical protein